MTRIVIFGTGSSALRALRSAQSRADIEVIGFSDNNPERHGMAIEGIPVIPPYQITELGYDFVELSGRITEIWALTEGMARSLERRYSRKVRHMPTLHQHAPERFKTQHDDFAPGFRAVMLGNLWQPWMLSVVDYIWCRCMDRLPGLRPLEWYVHPPRVQSLIEAGYALGDGVIWKGFLSGQALQDRLSASDLALLPFNGSESAQDDYTRFSLPSRLTELCGAGLPIVVIASADTEPARFVERRDCGVVVSGPDEDKIAGRLVEVIRGRETREHIGHRARQVAETEFARGPFQASVLTEFVRLADEFAYPATWRCRRFGEGIVPLVGAESKRTARLEDVTADRIHYACGRNLFPNWLNVDGFDESYPSGEVPDALSERIFRLDLTGPHPFPDGYFRLGYSEDFIEHISQGEFVIFLCEAYRTFRRGGCAFPRRASKGCSGGICAEGDGKPAPGSEKRPIHAGGTSIISLSRLSRGLPEASVGVRCASAATGTRPSRTWSRKRGLIRPI